MAATTGDDDATSDDTAAGDKAAGADKHRLTALEGLAALSLDALSSVAYGPEAIVIVLVAAGTVGLSYALPVTAAFAAAAALLVASKGDTQALIPLFAIGVFVGFTLSQAGMVRHWHQQRGRGWARRAAINGAGAVLTAVALAVELLSKFAEGAWLVVIVVPLLVLMFSRIHAAYDRIGAQLQIGERPPPPRKSSSLVVVPVGGMSRLTVAAISAALSLGDEVVAVTVCFTDSDDTEVDAHFRDQWEAWHPNVPLITLRSAHRALAPPIVDYLRRTENEDRYHRLVVLIAEVQPARPWQRILYNQRGFVLDQAIQRGTVNVVICRLHFKLSAMSGKH